MKEFVIDKNHENQRIDKYLKKYSEELKKRKILSKLRNTALTTTIKIILCKIDYRLYFKIHRMMCQKEDRWLIL